MGTVVSMPRRLEWGPIEMWEGRVKGTALVTRVVRRTTGFHWTALNGTSLISTGVEASLEEAQKAAKDALESLRVLNLPDGGVILG